MKALICVPNWIGDSVMAMPAVQAFRDVHPSATLIALTKPAVRELWVLNSSFDQLVVLEPGVKGLLAAAKQLRAAEIDIAWVLPNSTRAALVPWLAGIPRRIGYRGHWRSALLTEIVPPPPNAEAIHQSVEYLYLLCGSSNDPSEQPRISVPESARQKIAERLQRLPRPWITLIPGAARGPAKRWPLGNYAELAKRIVSEAIGGVVLSGTAEDRLSCEHIAKACGGNVANLAGETGLQEWIAVLASSQLVVCNDSGGMHVAAALGTPVIALFGMTDPRKTGPLGKRVIILQKSPTAHRDIPRTSKEAAKWLTAISPEEVYQHVREVLSPTSRNKT